MKAGNVNYIKGSDLPDELAILPLQSVLILPGGFLTLNIFEPRYLEMIDDALRGNRLLGVIQILPQQGLGSLPEVYSIGCLSRIISYSELGDGRLTISLQGICRFKRGLELDLKKPYRIFAIEPFVSDLCPREQDDYAQREKLLAAFAEYLDANELEADWESMVQASTETLVNALSVSAPFGPADKQALLEAIDLQERVDILIALAERALLTRDGITAKDLQ